MFCFVFALLVFKIHGQGATPQCRFLFPYVLVIKGMHSSSVELGLHLNLPLWISINVIGAEHSENGARCTT